MAQPNFRTGAEAAQAAAKSGGFAKTQFFQLEDGKSAILRFITDAFVDPNFPHVEAWITVDQHQRIPTKEKPDNWGNSKWPEYMSAVCRYDEAFIGMYSDCYICDHIVGNNGIKKPSARTWALACLREDVIGDGSEALGGEAMKGKVVGRRDVTREVTIPAREAKDGKPAQAEETRTEKAVVVVNMGWKNFFSTLEGYASHYGTVLDRDYKITRKGAGMDTDYNIIPLDPIQAKTANGEVKVMDLRHPEFAERYASSLDLTEVVAETATDKFYAKFFDPRYSASDDSDEVKETGAPAEQQAKPSNDPDPEKMAELTARVKGYNPQNGEAPAEAPQPAAVGAGAGGMIDIE